MWASPPPLKIGVGRIVPVAYFDDHGKAVGFAVDVMNEAARREGIPVSWTRLVKGVGEDIQSGTIDLLAAGMATQQRKQKLYVSEPWWFEELALLTRAGERQRLKRLGIQQVYVEFARPYFDPATLIIDTHNANEPAAIAANAVCKGTLDGALITHGELHDLFLNRPDDCTGVRLQSVDTAITYGLSIISSKSNEAVAKRLRKRIDDLILDGTLLRFASAHPPISLSGAIHLQERIRHRYQNRIWITVGCILTLLIGFLVWFLWDRQRDLTRTRQSEARIRELNRDLEGHVKQLRETQERLRRAQRVAQLGNWEQDLTATDLHVSDEACEIMGISAGASGPTTAERFFEAVHPEDRSTVREAFRASATESKPLRIEHRITHPGGGEKFVRQFGEPEGDRSGQGGRLLGTVQDITDYRQLEEKLRRAQKLEAIGQLAGGVAHDFNNLLVVIKGYTDMILSELGPRDPLEPPLREVLNAADRATALTRQLLAFSRRQVMRPQVMDLNGIIADIEKMLRPILVETIELRKDLAPTWPVKVDAGQIEQVIVNLVVNARDAMPKGGILTIGTGNVDLCEDEIRPFADLKPGRYVCLSVTDNGTGIPPEIKHRLFDPFFSTKPIGEGTGLGLSTVYGIVMQHGGDVSVYSDVGRGSVFRVYLPATEQPRVAAPSPDSRQSLCGGTETILLVEDDESVRKLASRMLERLGYTIFTARNGRDALDIAKATDRKIDLLLTDVVMPEMSGQELAEAVSALHAGLKLVFMSGYPGRVTAEFGVSEANMLFLQKPFSAEELGRRIRDALDK